MPSGKHKISRDKAEKMIKKFIEERGSGKPLPALPDGYIFDAEDVKTLLNQPQARHFIVSFGIKEPEANGKLKGEVSPILTVADEQYRTLQSTIIETVVKLSASESMNKVGDEGGGYLDEGKPYPPPPYNP
jgi:hypothetical protein